jgi:hypothetical protein
MLVRHVSLVILAALMVLISEVDAWGHRNDPDLPTDPRVEKEMRADRLKAKLKSKGDLPFD